MGWRKKRQSPSSKQKTPQCLKMYSCQLLSPGIRLRACIVLTTKGPSTLLYYSALKVIIKKSTNSNSLSSNEVTEQILLHLTLNTCANGYWVTWSGLKYAPKSTPNLAVPEKEVLRYTMTGSRFFPTLLTNSLCDLGKAAYDCHLSSVKWGWVMVYLNEEHLWPIRLHWALSCTSNKCNRIAKQYLHILYPSIVHQVVCYPCL